MAKSASRSRRWVVASVITVLAVGAVAIGGFYLALRPPISDSRVQQILDRLESLSVRSPLTPEEDATEEVRRALLTLSNALITWEGRSGRTLPELAGPPVLPVDDPAWADLRSTLQPAFAALEAIPSIGRIPRFESRLPRPFNLGEVRNVASAVQALATLERLQGRHEELVPLVNRALRLVLVREDDTIIGWMVASQLVLDLADTMPAGIPHAKITDLHQARDLLRGATATIADFDRAIAREAVGTLRLLRSAAEDPASLELTGYPGPVHDTPTYLRYQIAVTAQRWNRFFELPRDQGWDTLATATDQFAAELRNEADDWRTGIANGVWLNFDSFVMKLAEQQAETVLLRVAIAAELYRRDHGRYPTALSEILDRFDPDGDGLQAGATVEVQSDTATCTIRLRSILHPLTIKLEAVR